MLLGALLGALLRRTIVVCIGHPAFQDGDMATRTRSGSNGHHEMTVSQRTAGCGTSAYRSRGVWCLRGRREIQGASVGPANMPGSGTNPCRIRERDVRRRTHGRASSDRRRTGSDHAQGRWLYRQRSLTRSRIPPARRARSRYHRRHQMAQAQGSWIAARTAPFPASNEGGDSVGTNRMSDRRTISILRILPGVYALGW